MSEHAENFTSELPVSDYYTHITAAVDANQVTIITAETGAGKSTQVPQYLATHGYTKVIVTQPRILAARNLSSRVREEWSLRTLSDGEAVIGYRTAHERDDSPNTQILYCTDGLQLVREIAGEGTTKQQVLILDEVHEWNENMEVLIAWAKKRCKEDPHFKVVIMSATIDTGPLAAYFATQSVITVPGRSHPVTKLHGRDVVSEITKKIESKGSNMLVFLPGKAEIYDVTEAVAKKAAAAHIPIVPLHSQLEADAQQLAFASYPNGKIILSTNIAQTSVTIDDIDVVIDSGLERRSEVRNGVEGLFVAQVSQADCLQRAGRAGRTKAGEYILAPYDTLPCAPFDDRDAYGTPEILRKHIDRLTLRLANVGIDIETLDFYHDPSAAAIKRAKGTLVALGAMKQNGSVTDIGRAMERYPVESNFARMLVESQKYSSEVQSKLAAIIAIQEIGGIVKGGTRHTGWQRYTKQKNSDLLAQYDVFLSLDMILPDEHEELGIITKNVSKAREVMQRLGRDLQGIELTPELLTPIFATEEPELLRCIVAGMIDDIWVIDPQGLATHLINKSVREMSATSVVRYSPLVAGTPFDLEVPLREGKLQTLHLVQGITNVNTAWLLELAPQQFTGKRGKIMFEPRSGMLVTQQLLRVGKQVISGSGTPVTQNTKQNQKLFQESMAKWAFGQIERERQSLAGPHIKRIPPVPYPHVLGEVRRMAGERINLEGLSKDQRSQILKLSKLATYFGDEYVNQLDAMRRKAPSGGRHNAHRGWKPAHKRGGRDSNRGRR
ncbi:ATP-dependent RNA helicase [Candidatus Saccharibacteria bacterium]|nr:ATP-dependent RNA helicase [Candidatus Saccharibacteria bacterium]